MASNNFLYKPVSENTGNLVVLAPAQFTGKIDQVQLVDGQGNVIETGTFRTVANGGRAHFNFSRPGNAFGNDVQTVITFDDGRPPVTLGVGAGNRVDIPFSSEGVPQGVGGQPSNVNEGQFFQLASPGSGAERAAASGGVPNINESNIQTTPGGTDYVVPGGPDFNQLGTPYINFQQQLAQAGITGQQAANIFYDNIGRSGQPALDIVNTDIAGTEAGLDALVPRVREAERQDNAQNISNAAAIDEFNFSRLPCFNEFNTEAQRQAVEGSGIDYRGRITSVLDSLRTRAEGGIPAGLGEALDRSIQNQGSDLLRSSGVSSISGAGARAIQRLQVNERLNLALDAENRLPAVLQNAQAVLQPPATLATPTQVPLTPSTVAARIPVTPNISAGQTQLNLAKSATDLQAIPATTALAQGLVTEQFNQNAAFKRDLTVLEVQQIQQRAADNALQGALFQDQAAAQRAEQRAALTNGLVGAATVRNEALGGGTTGGTTTAPTDGPGTIWENGDPNNPNPYQPIIDAIDNSTDFVESAAEVLDAGIEGFDRVFGNDDGTITIGNTTIPSDTFTNWYNEAAEFFTGVNPGTGFPTKVNGQEVVSARTNADAQETEYILADGTSVLESKADSISGGVIGAFKDLGQPFLDAGLDAKTLAQTTSAIANWDQLSASQQIQATSNLGLSVLQNRGDITKEQANDIQKGIGAITTITNPNSTDQQRIVALADATSSALTTSFTGPVNNPTSIGGVEVVGGRSLTGGGAEYYLANGDVVSSDTLNQSLTAQAGVTALGVLTSNASTESKLSALTALGISTSKATGIINQVQAGNAMAALSIFNTTMNWDKMNDIQKAIAVTQSAYVTTQAITTAAAQTGTSGTGAGLLSFFNDSATITASQATAASGAAATGSGAAASGSSTLATVGQGLQIVGAAVGIYNAATTIAAANDMPRSQTAATTGNLAVSGASIGASIGSMIVPGAGTVLGAGIGAAIGATTGFIVGATSTAKGSGQLMRDAWRDGLEAGGFTDITQEGAHNVTLADGSTYDIGVEGDAKLDNVGTNVDGSTDRYVFDVDWSNPVAVESVPDAHIFAIATGLDPTSNDKFDLFNKATGESLNAATSNATSRREVQDNIKAMLKDSDPREVAMRVETLRLTNKITEGEYNAYLDSINGIYGSKILPTGRKEATDFFVKTLSEASPEELSASGKDILKVLTDPQRYIRTQKELEKRLAKDMKELESEGNTTTRSSFRDITRPGARTTNNNVDTSFRNTATNSRSFADVISNDLTDEQRAQFLTLFPDVIAQQGTQIITPQSRAAITGRR